MISTHSLPADAFAELASGAGDSAIVRQLRQAQLSKHLMLLRIVADATDGVDPPSPATAAFRAGYQLLAEVQAADPGAVARLFGLPHIGSWAHDCLDRLDRKLAPDFGYLAGAAAAAAIRAGIRFELEVEVHDHRALLPGLGYLQVADPREWIRLSSDGERLRVGEQVDMACAALVPDDGSGGTIPHWRGTPLVRVVAGERTWEVLLETADWQLDRYAPFSMLTAMTASEVTNWRSLLQAAWELLVRHHEWAAGPIAAGVLAVVPLTWRSGLNSATSPAAFGAIATSEPPSPVIMAETLVHEFQHMKLCGLMDMLPLVEQSGERGYAPWREDPRPLGGLLQGAYAFTGVVRFWDGQRRAETEPDDALRADVLYERWRLAIEEATGALLKPGLLTQDGVDFVTVLKERGQRQESGPVPAEAIDIAREAALDNQLTWQLRHTALDGPAVAQLAAAYRRGERLGDRALPEARIEADSRKIGSSLRSDFLEMRFQGARRYRQLLAADLPGLSKADALLIRGEAAAAVEAYRAELAGDPDPAAWIGLALAVHRLPAVSSRHVFASQLPLLFEMHAWLVGQRIHVDPLDLADWFE